MEKEKKSQVHKANVGFPLTDKKTGKTKKETETSPTYKTNGSVWSKNGTGTFAEQMVRPSHFRIIRLGEKILVPEILPL